MISLANIQTRENYKKLAISVGCPQSFPAARISFRESDPVIVIRSLSALCFRNCRFYRAADNNLVPMYWLFHHSGVLTCRNIPVAWKFLTLIAFMAHCTETESPSSKSLVNMPYWAIVLKDDMHIKSRTAWTKEAFSLPKIAMIGRLTLFHLISFHPAHPPMDRHMSMHNMKSHVNNLILAFDYSRPLHTMPRTRDRTEQNVVGEQNPRIIWSADETSWCWRHLFVTREGKTSVAGKNINLNFSRSSVT